LAKVRALKSGPRNLYTDDYADLGELQKLAAEHNIALLVIHHTRKAMADDAMDDVSGSIGLTAAADTILLLRRDRGKAEACLSIHGRDIEEQEIALAWDVGKCIWSYLGDARQVRMSEERRTVIDCIQKAETAPTPKQISELLGKPVNSIKQMLLRLTRDGTVKSDEKGRYRLISEEPVTGLRVVQ
jgi:hypothetical protein